MIKAFISVPMKGKEKEEIDKTIAEMKKIATYEIGPDVEFVNTMVQEKPPYKDGNEAIWYLGKALEILSQCRILVYLKGSEIYNGCFIEKEAAKRYGLLLLEIDL